MKKTIVNVTGCTDIIAECIKAAWLDGWSQKRLNAFKKEANECPASAVAKYFDVVA